MSVSGEIDATDVFVSYAPQDAAVALAITRVLRSAGVNLWRDENRPVGWAGRDEAVESAIRRSKAVVLMCSPHAFASAVVHREVGETWERGHRRILPIWLTPPLPAHAVPDRFRPCLEGRPPIFIHDPTSAEWLPGALDALMLFGVRVAPPVARLADPPVPEVGWTKSLLSFGKKYGKTAGFVAKVALQTFVPGAPLLADLAEKLFQAGAEAARTATGEDVLRAAQATSADVGRLAQVLTLLEEDVGALLTQVAALQSQPDRARHLLALARSTDGKAQAVLVKLDALAGRFDRVEGQNDRLLQGQEELLGLVRSIATGTHAPLSPAAASAPAALPLIDSRDLARREQLRWAQRQNREPSWTNDLGVRFRLIPPGRFRLGAAAGDPHASVNEKPAQTATIARPFWVATFPLTAGAVRQFVQEASAADGPDVAALLRDRAFAYQCRHGESSDDLPGTEINCADALVLCRWLGLRDGRRYRLPTEEEWEYAARAGAGGLYWWEEGLPAAVRAIFAATGPASASDRRANGWGLCDVLGNVAEWTGSEYGALDSGLSSGPAARGGTTLSVRGGCWRDPLEQVRLSRRLSMNAAARKDWLGVRLVCDVEEV